MNTTKLLAAMLFVSLVGMQPAHADWYAGLDVGASRTDSEIDEYPFLGVTTDSASGSTTAFRLRGGYQFGRFFALEVAYVDFGQFENHFDPDDCPSGAPGPCPVDVRTSIDGFFGSLVGIVPIGEHWYLGARLGYGKMNLDTQDLSAAGVDGSSKNDAFHYGIGAGYRFKDHWEVLLDYSEYNQEEYGLTLNGEFGSYNPGESSVTSLGISYHW